MFDIIIIIVLFKDEIKFSVLYRPCLRLLIAIGHGRGGSRNSGRGGHGKDIS